MEPILLFLPQILTASSIPHLDYNAYLDPGSGSFILQLLIASLVGGAFLLKTYWRRINGFFHNLFTKGKDEEEE